jgi:hypothetical protein
MRVFAIAAVAIAVLATPAHAQLAGGKRHHKSDPTDQTKKKVDDKAYQDALSKIPDAKQEYDPWQKAR